MRMAVNDAIDAVARERRDAPRPAIDVHDLRRRVSIAAMCGLAARAHASASPAAGADVTHEHELPERIAHDAAQALIRVIVGAEQIAVHQQTRRPYRSITRAVRQQLVPVSRAEAPAEQEIAIAVNQEGFTPASVTARSPAMTRRLSAIRVVVADPGFEQVAEDVQRLRTLRLASRNSRNCRVMSGRVPSRCRSEMKSVVTERS